MSKIILDLCGGTGAWSKPYKDAGYDVRLVTLPEHDVRLYIPPENVHGILAAPPCTEFSRARQKNRHMKLSPQRDFEKGLAIVDACLRIVIRCNPQWWALENPVGYLRRWLGKPRHTFHPWQYGDPWTKRTDLWGTFIAPVPFLESQQDCIEKLPMPVKDLLRSKGISPSIRSGKLLPSKADLDKTTFKYTGMQAERSAFRAITPPGFAQAFFEANP